MSRTRILAALAALACTPGIAAAIGVAPVKSGRYKGALAAPYNRVKISWTVSSSGKRVTKLATTDTAIYCAAGGGAVPMSFGAVAVKNGTFTATAQRLIASGPSKGKPQVKVTITGRFAKHRRATGTVKADWFGSATDCDGKTAFTAKAS